MGYQIGPPKVLSEVLSSILATAWLLVVYWHRCALRAIYTTGYTASSECRRA